MNAILILLGMFSLTLFISNLNFLKKVNAFSFISIPILIGIFFSPEQGLMPILPSKLNELSWAVKVGLTWVAFLIGTRIWKTRPSWQSLVKLSPFFLGYFIFFLTTLVIIRLFSFSEISLFAFDSSTLKLIAIAVILSASIFSSKENPFLLLFFFLSLLYLFTNNLHDFTLMNLFYPLAVGFLMGIICRLIIPTHKSLDIPGRLTLAGVCILAAGWAASMGDLEVLVGLGFGWSMAILHSYRVYNDPTLTRTYIPLEFIMALFCGMFIDLNVDIIIIGVLLAFARFALKAGILNIGLRKANIEEVLTTIIPISHLALPVMLSLHLSKFNNNDTTFILSCFCIGFIANDLLALTLELVKRDIFNTTSIHTDEVHDERT